MVIRFLSACLFAVFVNTFLNGDDRVIRQAFLDGVVESSKVVDGIHRSWRLSSSSGKIDISNKQGDHWGKLPDSKHIYGCSIRGKSSLKTAIDRHGVESMSAVNDDYAFKVSRTNSQGDLTIEFIEKLGRNSITDERLNSMKAESLCIGLVTWYVFRMPLNELISSPDFKLRKAARISGDDGGEVVRVEFDHLVEDSSRKASRVSNGYLICDPSRYWAIKEFGGTIWSGGKYECRVDWDEHIQGFPHAKRVQITITSDKMPPNTEYHGLDEITEIQTEVPEEIFYLSHYGFPEPVFDNSWLSAWQKYLLAGIACIAVAYFAQRRRAAA